MAWCAGRPPGMSPGITVPVADGPRTVHDPQSGAPVGVEHMGGSERAIGAHCIISCVWAPPRLTAALDRARVRLLADGAARAAMVIGSVARGVASDASDVDLLVVANATATTASAENSTTMCSSRSFRNQPTPGAHACAALVRDGCGRSLTAALFDDGVLGSLVVEASEMLRTFRTPADVKAELATNLWHARAKLERALHSDDEPTLLTSPGCAFPTSRRAARHQRPAHGARLSASRDPSGAPPGLCRLASLGHHLARQPTGLPGDGEVPR